MNTPHDPTKPRVINQKEIEAKQRAWKKSVTAFAKGLEESMKKNSVTQKACISYQLDGIFPFINILSFDWSTGKELKEANPESFKAFSVELKALMAEHRVRQEAILNSDEVGAMRPRINMYRYDWSKVAETEKANTEVAPE